MGARAVPRISSPIPRVETQYFGFDWGPVTSRDEAAFAIHVVRDPSGLILERRHESFKPYPTKATDPKTGSRH